MKTGNQYREIEIHPLLIASLLINQVLKNKETVEFIKLHTSIIFIRYRMKIYSLLFLNVSG